VLFSLSLLPRSEGWWLGIFLPFVFARSMAAGRDDRSLHICLIGDSGIGQSSLLRAYRGGGGIEGEGPLSKEQESFIDAVDVEGEPYRVRFTDSAGKPAFDRVRRPVLRTAHTVLVCFSVARPDSLTSAATKWIPMLRELSPDVPIILLGLQADLRGPEDQGGEELVRADQAAELAEQIEAAGYLECSSFDPENVRQVMEKTMLTAREFYGYQKQRSRMRSTEKASSDQRVAERDLAGLDPFAPTTAEFLAETLTIDDDTTPLRSEDIPKRLSVLGIIPSGRHSYLRVDFPDLGLTSIDALRTYEHLQFVNVRNNSLRSLEPLSVLPFLLHLNASQNLLTRTQNFAPPRQLETVDMSYNMIGEVGDWSVHKSLRELNLRGNFIQRVPDGALNRNKALRMLDLSENHVRCIENLEHLNLQALYMAQNQLTSLEGIGTLSRLQVLNVKRNEIQSLQHLSAEELPELRKLAISENRIGHIREIERLAHFPFLADLFLAPNPIDELPWYRSQILHRLKRLRWLDDSGATAEEKIKADVAYGADVDNREQIFSALLPDESFVDRRLVTEEMMKMGELEKFGNEGGLFYEDQDAELLREAAQAAAEGGEDLPEAPSFDE